MPIEVELFGIPRAKAGVARTTAEGDSLGALIEDIARRFPAFAEECLDQGELRPCYIANLGGDRFVRDLQTPISEGQVLLILSADGGG